MNAKLILDYADREWRYIGKSGGRGDVHRVISVSEKEVISVSGTHAWLGPACQFLKEFQVR